MNHRHHKGHSSYIDINNPSLSVIKNANNMVKQYNTPSNMKDAVWSDKKSSYTGFITGLQKLKFLSTYTDEDHTLVYSIFFPCKDKEAPVLLFNPGGPGDSGLLQIFEYYLPYAYNIAMDNWIDNSINDLTKSFNLIYIDFPANVGYSKVIRKTIYGDQQSTNMVTSVITKLLQKYHLFKNNINFFGYSYAGKIWPMVALKLKMSGYKVNGLAIFSGYTDPVLQEIRSLTEYLMYNGAINNDSYDKYELLTNKIESLLSMKIPNVIEATKLYKELDSGIFDITGLQQYNVSDDIYNSGGKLKHSIENVLHTADALFNNKDVKVSLGSNTEYHVETPLFDPLNSYVGFLTSSRDSLKTLGDMDVFILYFMGSFDASTLAKGTRDMFNMMYGTPINEDIWSYRKITNADNQPNIIYGKIVKYKSNVYYGTIYAEGHDLSGPRGLEAFNMIMKFLYSRTINYYTI